MISAQRPPSSRPFPLQAGGLRVAGLRAFRPPCRRCLLTISTYSLLRVEIELTVALDFGIHLTQRTMSPVRSIDLLIRIDTARKRHGRVIKQIINARISPVGKLPMLGPRIGHSRACSLNQLINQSINQSTKQPKKRQPTQQSIHTSNLIPHIKIPLLQVTPHSLKLPHIMYPHFHRALIRPHLRSERLPCRCQQSPNGLRPIRNKHPPQKPIRLSMLDRVPLHDLVAGVFEFLNRLPQRPSHGRSRRHDAIVVEHGKLETRLGLDGPPRDGDAFRIVVPRLFVDDGLTVQDYFGEGPGHGAVHTSHGFLALEAREGATVRESAC